MSTIGSRIQASRSTFGWSQTELARRMTMAGWPNYTQMTVSRTEKGERTPRLDESVALARTLGITLEHLAGITSGNGGNGGNGLDPISLQAAIEAAVEAIENLRWEEER